MAIKRRSRTMIPVDEADAARIAAMTPSEYQLEYQLRYYQQNKEKAKQYQRQYNLTHKKKKRKGRFSAHDSAREVVRSTFNTADIMHTQSPDKVARMVNKILKGERLFTM